MFFRIESIIHDRRHLLLVDSGNLSDENFFTIVTGRNASGKSRLLRKIVSNYIFSDQYDLLEASDVLPSFYSATRPSRIIAVSTGVRDRFPRSSDKVTESGLDYRYIGAFQERGKGSRGVTTLSSCFLQVIKNLSVRGRSRALVDAFEMLGFGSHLNLTVGEGYEVKKEREIRDALSKAPDFYQDAVLKKIDFLYKTFRARPGGKINLQLDIDGGYRDSRVEEILPLLIELVEEGHLRVWETELYSLKEKSKLKINEGSSGQQCMIQMLVGLAASVRDGSLVCIDEPEISLHPEWQTKFISLLQDIFKDYKGCHFFIATHSPQIIAGLRSENSCVINLEDHSLILSGEYSSRSADFQLSNIFEEPGFRNEFLVRSTLKIISKIANDHLLDGDDKKMLRHFSKIKGRLRHDDPVLHLISQIQVLVGGDYGF